MPWQLPSVTTHPFAANMPRPVRVPSRIIMLTFFKSFRFSLKPSRQHQTLAEAAPAGILSPAEMRRLVADMVD
jgi:hypothetical protein